MNGQSGHPAVNPVTLDNKSESEHVQRKRALVMAQMWIKGSAILFHVQVLNYLKTDYNLHAQCNNEIHKSIIKLKSEKKTCRLIK